VHQQQIALGEQGKKGALPLDIMLQLFERSRGFGADVMLLGGRELASFGPAKAKHLV